LIRDLYNLKMAENKKIRALFTFEILGKPPEHIKETMSQVIDKLGELPGIEIDNKKVHEPRPVEKDDMPDLFTTFAEAEVLGKNIEDLMMVVFYAMPSHVEIIQPEELVFRNSDLSSLFSGLTSKLHRYDEIAKASIMERNILVQKMNEMQKKISELEQKSDKGEGKDEDEKDDEQGKNKDKEKHKKQDIKKSKKKVSKDKKKN